MVIELHNIQALVPKYEKIFSLENVFLYLYIIIPRVTLMVVKIIADREVFQPPLHFKLRSLPPDSAVRPDTPHT